MQNHKHIHVLHLTLIPAICAALGSLRAQTWQTVLNYQLAPGQSAVGSGFAADTAGNVFAGGNAHDSTGTAHGLIFKTDTTEFNWGLSDDNNPTPTQDFSQIADLGFDAYGNLYSFGSLITKSSSSGSWLLRKSADGGASWSTVSVFQYTSGMDSRGYAFAADTLANIYTVGYGSGPATRLSPGALHWLVRKSTDGGLTWTLAEDFFTSAKGGFPQWGIPLKAHFAPGIGLFVVGQTSTGQTGYPLIWTVRRSMDGGTTWSTVDLNSATGSAYIASANGVSSDAQGNVYVVGRIDVCQTVKHKSYNTGQWVVRKSSDGGNTWSSVDMFSGAIGSVSSAHAVGLDAAGNIVVAGQYPDAQGVEHWIVRRPDAFGDWRTVDDFQLAPGYGASAGGVGVDSAGNLLISGSADDANGTHWIVRRTNP